MSFQTELVKLTDKYRLKLRNGQVNSLQMLYERECDLVINLPTGYGKSLISYLLPELIGAKRAVKNPVALVISPLNLLQNDQLGRLAEMGIASCRLDRKGSTSTLVDDEENNDYACLLV